MRNSLLVAAAAVLISTTAFAENVTLLKTLGRWSAFHVAATSDGGQYNGEKMCGMVQRFDDNSAIYIKYSVGDALKLHFMRPHWTLPSNQKVSIRIEFDGKVWGETQDGFALRNVGDRSSGVWTRIRDDSSESFLSNFAAGQKMAVRHHDLPRGWRRQHAAAAATGHRHASGTA